jgi:hypothetical protein
MAGWVRKELFLNGGEHIDMTEKYMMVMRSSGNANA